MLASFSLCLNKKSPARSARMAWRCDACARLAEQRRQGSTRPTQCLRARDGPCYAMLALLGALSQIGQNGQTCEATSLLSAPSLRGCESARTCRLMLADCSSTLQTLSSTAATPARLEIRHGPSLAADSLQPAVQLFRPLLCWTRQQPDSWPALSKAGHGRLSLTVLRARRAISHALPAYGVPSTRRPCPTAL